MPMDKTRRRLLLGAAGVSVAGLGVIGGAPLVRALNQPKRRVGVYRHSSYDRGLVDLLSRGLEAFPATIARARGGRVVLKPNLVEFHPDRPINTDARFIVAAAEAFLHHGAKEVVVAEGPGHMRDTEFLIEQTGLEELLRDIKGRFVDLNVDTPIYRPLANNFTDLGQLPFGQTALDCDLLVSLAKMKCHHWTGVTLTMKNLFGVVPSGVVGWPKNPLHWAGLHQSILDIFHALQPGFGMVDGIVAMEGDGPIMGTAKAMHTVVMGDHLPAVDATTARLMGIDPEQLDYIRIAGNMGATTSPWRVETVGDEVKASPFAVLPKFEHLLL